MAKVWTGYDDVDQAVDTLIETRALLGYVPAPLLTAVQEHLPKTTPGMRLRFYRRVLDRDPELLPLLEAASVAAA